MIVTSVFGGIVKNKARTWNGGMRCHWIYVLITSRSHWQLFGWSRNISVVLKPVVLPFLLVLRNATFSKIMHNCLLPVVRAVLDTYNVRLLPCPPHSPDLWQSPPWWIKIAMASFGMNPRQLAIARYRCSSPTLNPPNPTQISYK